MRKAMQGGGVALSAVALLVMTGLQAAAEPEDLVETEALAAIEATVGEVLDTAVPVADADTVVATGDGVTVELAADATQGVALTSTDDVTLEVGLPFASEADEAAVIDGTVVFDNNNGSTTTPLVHEDGSLQILTTIADANAPTEYAYDVDIPADGEAILRPDGGVDIVDGDGVIVVAVGAPWAIDARGLAVPTSFAITESGIVQHVAHGEADYAYPVVADPSISFGVGIYYHFNKAETQAIGKDWVAITAGSTAACAAAGGALGSIAPGVGTAIGSVAAGAGCLAVVGPIAFRAAVAMGSKPMRCLYIRVIPGLGVAGVWNGTYLDSRCRW